MSNVRPSANVFVHRAGRAGKLRNRVHKFHPHFASHNYNTSTTSSPNTPLEDGIARSSYVHDHFSKYNKPVKNGMEAHKALYGGGRE